MISKNEITQRFIIVTEYLVKSKNFKSNKELAAFLGLTPSHLSDLKNRDKRYVNVDSIGKILDEFPNINIKWLLTGKGEMLDNEIEKLKVDELEKINHDLLIENKTLKEVIIELKK